MSNLRTPEEFFEAHKGNPKLLLKIKDLVDRKSVSRISSLYYGFDLPKDSDSLRVAHVLQVRLQSNSTSTRCPNGAMLNYGKKTHCQILGILQQAGIDINITKNGRFESLPKRLNFSMPEEIAKVFELDINSTPQVQIPSNATSQVVGNTPLTPTVVAENGKLTIQFTVTVEIEDPKIVKPLESGYVEELNINSFVEQAQGRAELETRMIIEDGVKEQLTEQLKAKLNGLS